MTVLKIPLKWYKSGPSDSRNIAQVNSTPEIKYGKSSRLLFAPSRSNWLLMPLTYSVRDLSVG